MKSALITFGNEESYGLSFVGGELLKYNQDIRFFEGDEGNWLRIRDWKPDFLMFSPLTTFFPAALNLAKTLKRAMPNVNTVFGGHHVLSDQRIVDGIDTMVVGPVRGSIGRILDGEVGLIKTIPTNPSDMPRPARSQYYGDIPRVGKRYRKFLLSMLGCPWNCSYCSSSSGHISNIFSHKIHRDYFLEHRPLPEVMEEARLIARYDTHEIEWVDDDIFISNEEWLLDFIKEWEKSFSGTIVDPYGENKDTTLPMYISTTSFSALKVSDKVLEAFLPHVSAVGMGIQAIRPESLRLFNRQWDNESRMKAAYDRLTSFGYRVNLQAIVGLPIPDPVEDAIETIMAMQRIGAGSICSVYPLMIYPGTKMEKYCIENNIRLNTDCSGDTNNAIPGIAFDRHTEKQLRNICKLATMFVRYNIDERWMRLLIKCDFDLETSQQLSMARYYECVTDRLGHKGKEIFDTILNTMRLKY